MRDVLLLSIIVVVSVVAIWRPWIGVLAWTWVSVMNPHRYTWVAAELPVAAIVAGATLIGVVVTRDKRHFFVTPESGTLALFMLWICIAYPFSDSVQGSYEMWSKVMKVDFMILVTLLVLYTKRHIVLFAWVVVLSLAYYGVKGGVFTLLHGGDFRVYGPPGGFVEDNNELALALIVVIPLMRFLQLQCRAKWAKLTWTLAMLLTAAAAIGSHSRGALIGLIAMGLFLWTRSERKLGLGILIVITAIGLIAFMPSQWTERMETIGAYEADGSAMGRINAWKMAWNLASSRLTGGGFDIYTPHIFAQYAPNPLDVHAAHSIYFQVLGEHGFIGLLLFLLIWFFTWRSAGWLYRKGKEEPESRWASDLGGMCQASLVGYGVAGAFLSLAYFDLPYNIMVMVVLAKRLVEGRVQSPEAPIAPESVLDSREMLARRDARESL